MDRDAFIKAYTTTNINEAVHFVTTILLEYEKPIDKIQQLIQVCMQIGLFEEIFVFLREKEQLKYNLTILKDSKNNIIKIY